MFVIEDELHAEHVSEHESFASAVGELERLAKIPWNEAPNVAPCTSWRTCGRHYEVVEYDTSTTPWRTLQRKPALKVSARALEWLL